MLPSLLKLFKDGPVTEELPPRVDPETFKPEAPRPEAPKALVRLAPIREAPAPKPLSDDTIRQRAIRKWAAEQALKGDLDPAAMGAVGPEAERGYYEWEARRRGIGEDIPGTDAIRVGEALPPREVDFTDPAFTDMARKVADAKERAPELSVGNRFGFQYDPPQDPPEIAFRNEAGRLGEEPGALEAGVTGLVGIPAGAFNAGWKMGQRAAGEAPTGVLPDGYIPGVGIGETIAEAPDAIAQALKKRAMNTVARVQEKGLGAAVKEETGIDLRRPTWLGGETSAEDKERRKAAGVDSIADSLIEGVSRIPDELKGLAVSTWQAGLGAASGASALDDRSIPTERKVDKALDVGGRLATDTIKSFVDTVQDPRSSFEKAPVSTVLNATALSVPLTKAAAKATTGRAAEVAKLEDLAAKFEDGVRKSDAADIRSELAAERASITEAQGDLLRRRRDLHETGNYDNTSQRTKALDDMAAEEEALAARADQLTMSEAEFKAGPKGNELAELEKQAADARAAVDAARAKGGFLRPKETRTKTLPELEAELAAKRAEADALAGEVMVQAKLAKATNKKLDDALAAELEGPPRYWTDDMPTSESRALKDATRAHKDQVRALRVAEVNATGEPARVLAEQVAELDKKVKKHARADAIVRQAARVPSWVASFGVTGATDIVTHLARRALAAPGNGFRRYVAYARTNRVPEEMLALEREAAGAASRAELDVTDALQSIPEDVRPTVAEVLRRESGAAMDVGPVGPPRWPFAAAPRTILEFDARKPRVLADPATVAVADRAKRAQDLADVGNQYGAKLWERAKADHEEGARLGLWDENPGPAYPNNGREPVWPAAEAPNTKTPVGKAPERNVSSQYDAVRRAGYQAKPPELESALGRPGLEGDVARVLDRSNRVRQHQLYEKAAVDPAIAITEDQFKARRLAEIAEKTLGKGDEFPKATDGIVTDADWMWKPVPNDPKKWGKLAGRYVKEDVWYELANAAALSEQMAERIPRAIAKWKGGVTAWNPITHGRNVLTNALIFAPMAGISPLNPKNLPWFSEALKDLARGTPSEAMRDSIAAGTFKGGWRAEVPKIVKRGDVPYKAPAPSSLYGQALKVVDDHIGGALRAGLSPVTGLLKLAYAAKERVRPALSKQDALRLAVQDLMAEGRTSRTVKLSESEMAAFKVQARKRAKTIYEEARRRNVKRLALEGASEAVSLPGAIYGVEDDVFRHALFLKERAALAERTPEALSAIGKKARQAFMDYENVPGFVNLVRSPFSPVTDGAVDGVVRTNPLGQLAFYGAGQPFISYTTRAIPAVQRWLADNPIIAQTWVNLHEQLTDLSYLEAGYDEETRARMERSADRTMDFPEVELLPYGVGADGEVRIVNLDFLNPAGNYLPKPDSLESGLRNTARYLRDVGIASNPFLDMAQGVLDNRDPFTRQPIAKSLDSSGAAVETAGWLGAKLAPRAVVNYLAGDGSLGDLVAGPGYKDKFGRTVKPEVMKTREVDPEKELGKAGRAVYSLLKRADDSARATLADAGTPVLARYSDMDPGTRKRFDAAWVEGVRPFTDAVREKLEKLPASPQQKRALAKLRSALRVKDPARVRAKLLRLFGGLSGDLGDLQARLRKEADEGQENP